MRAFGVLLAVVLSAIGGGRTIEPPSRHSRRSIHLPIRSAVRRRCGGDGHALLGCAWARRGVVCASGGPQCRRHSYNHAHRRHSPTRLGRQPRSPAANEAIARELADGHPILTLIEDRPGTFHYIVIIGATPRAVVYHDPARTAFRTMSREEFDRRWSAAGRWMALVVPPAADGANRHRRHRRRDGPCRAV